MADVKGKRRWVPSLFVMAVVIAVFVVMSRYAVNGFAPATRTRLVIGMIDEGMERFRVDFGHLPQDALEGGAETNDPRWIRRWLLGMGDDGEPDQGIRSNPKWRGPYVAVRMEKHLDGDNDYVFVDSWGNPLLFEVKRPVLNPERWDIWSLGPDGKGTRLMSEIEGESPEERLQKYDAYEEGGKRTNRDNVDNR